MKPETLDALNESIVHYERLLTGEDLDIYDDSCALCRRFGCGFCATEDGEECPTRCIRGTPWFNLYEHVQKSHWKPDAPDALYAPAPDVANCPDCVKLITAELEHLKSLKENQ
jgi:hypothetical protein